MTVSCAEIINRQLVVHCANNAFLWLSFDHMIKNDYRIRKSFSIVVYVVPTYCII